MSETFPLTWEEVARSHGRKIYNYAYRLSGNPHDANDLVQEVLLRVRSGLAEYQPGSFEGWLWRITRNAFLDEVRKRRRRPSVPFPDDSDQVLASFARPLQTRSWPISGSTMTSRKHSPTFPTSFGKQ